MTRKTSIFDTSILRRAQQIAAITAAGLALGMPALSQAQAPATPSTPTTPSAGATADKAGDKGMVQPSADAFKKADVNGDGKLSKEEIAGIEGWSAKFDSLDKDKDGSLSMSEYMAAK